MTAGAWKLAVTMQGDTTNLVDVEFYTNGSTYFDYGGQANLSTGTNDYGATITSIGGSAWRYEKTYTFPANTTTMQVRLLVMLAAKTSSYVSSGEAIFAGQMTFSAI